MAAAVPPEPGSARRLLELLEVARASTARAEKSLAGWLPRIEAGPEAYKAQSDAARAKVEAMKTTPRGLPIAAIKPLALKFASAASLDEEQAVQVTEAFLFENPVRELDTGDGTILDLLDFYLDERLALVSLPAALARISGEQSHAYRTSCETTLMGMLERGLEPRMIERCKIAAAKVMAAQSANKAIASRLLAGALSEVCAHMEALFSLYYSRLEPGPVRLQAILEMCAEHEYGRRLTLALSASSAATGPAATLAARVPPLCIVLLLCLLSTDEVRDLTRPHYLSKDATATARLHRYVSSPSFGASDAQCALRLAWGTLSSFAVQTGICSAELLPGASELVARDYNTALSALSAGLALIEPHSAHPLALRATVESVLSLLLTTFPSLPHSPPLLQLHSVIYTDAPPLVARFWQQDARDEMRGSLLSHALSVFPCQTEPLLRILTPLVADAESARLAYQSVSQLPVVCSWLDDVRQFCEDIGDGQVRAVHAFELWGALIPLHTRGEVRANTVVWFVPNPVDGWRILAQQLCTFVSSIVSVSSTQASSSLVSPSSAALALAAQLMSLLKRLVTNDLEIAPLLDRAFAQPSIEDLPALLCHLIERAPLFSSPSDSALTLFSASFALLHLYGDVPRSSQLDLTQFIADTLAETGLKGEVETVTVLEDEGISTVAELAAAVADGQHWTLLAARLGPAAAPLVPALSPRTRLARLLARNASSLFAALRSLLPSQEAPAGKYPITQAAVVMLVAHFEWAAQTSNASRPIADVSRWAAWVQGDVLTGFEAWRYTHAEDKWLLGSALFDLLSALLRLPSRTQLLPALAADPSLHHVLLSFAGVGHRRLERLHLARQPRAAAALEAAVERALTLLATLMSNAPPPALLSALLSRRSGAEPLVLTLALYVLYLYSAAVPVRALKLLTLVAACAGRGSRAGSLVGFLGPHAESISFEFARRVGDRASPAALRSALLVFLAAAFETQPGLVPHLLREIEVGTMPLLLKALMVLLDDEKVDATLRKQALATLEAMYGASPDLLNSARQKDTFWKCLLKVLQSGGSRPSADEWQVRAQVLRLLAQEALGGAAADSPVAKAIDGPLSETLKNAGLPDALEAALSKATEGALVSLRDEAVPHAERLSRLAAAARLTSLPRMTVQGDGDAYVYDYHALGAYPELAHATRQWNSLLSRAAALDSLCASALRLLVAAHARKFTPLTTRLTLAVAARLLSWLVHLFDGALAPEAHMRSQYPLLPLGLPSFCPVFSVLVSRIALSLVQLILHLLHALRAAPVPVTLPSADRFAQLSSLLLQRTLSNSVPSVPLLSAAQTLLLLALRTEAGRDEALRGGVLEALLGAQLKILGLNSDLVASVYAVLARLHHAVSTPHFAAAGLYERLTALLIAALSSDKTDPVKQLLNLLLALAAEPTAAEALVAHGVFYALAKDSAASEALWPSHIALVARLLNAVRSAETSREGVQQWLEVHRPALLSSLSPPTPRAPVPLAFAALAARVALVLHHLTMASRKWRSAALLAPGQSEIIALLALLNRHMSLVSQPQLLERAFVKEGQQDTFVVRAEEAVLGGVQAVLQTLLDVCASQPSLVLLLPYVSSTPPAHLSDSPLPTMGAFADWIVTLSDLLLPPDSPDSAPLSRSASHKALILRVADLCIALCLHHSQLFLTQPAHEQLRRRFRSEVVAEIDGHVTRLLQGLKARKIPLDLDLLTKASEALSQMRRDVGSGASATATDVPRAAMLV